MRGEQRNGWGFDTIDDPRLAIRRAAAEAQRMLTPDETSAEMDRRDPDTDEPDDLWNLVASGVGEGDRK